MPHATNQSSSPTPPVSATPIQRAKFWSLVVFAVVILLLIWFLSFPFDRRGAHQATFRAASFVSIVTSPFKAVAKTLPAMADRVSQEIQ